MNSPGFSDIIQWPASILCNLFFGKNLFIAGIVSSDMYRLLLPFRNNAGLSYLTSSVYIYGNFAILSKAEDRYCKGIENLR